MSGGLRVALQHASGLAKLGHQVTLLLPSYAGQDYFSLPDNVELMPVHVGNSTRRFLGNLATVLALGQAIPACDVVLANSWQPVYPALISQRRHPGNRIVLLLQGLDSSINVGRAWPVRLRNHVMFEHIYRSPIPKIVVSSWLQRALKERYKQVATCVPNGVDYSVFTGGHAPRWIPPKESYDVLCLARIHKWKGFQDIVSAVRGVAASNSQVRLIVATRDRLDLPSDFPVVVVSPQNDAELGRLYQSCSVFVFPSWQEGFGLPVLEAMACGAPVVTTACGGVSDFVHHGENCLVVPPRQPERLAHAINCLCRDPVLAQRLATKGIETAREFSATRSVQRLERVLLEMIR